jgi:hypothetical protein
VTAFERSHRAAWQSRFGAYIWWEINAPNVSERSTPWIRLVGLQRSDCENIFRGEFGQILQHSRGRKTLYLDLPKRRLAAANGFLQQAADAPRIGREIGYLDGFAAFIIETVARWAI